MLLVVLLINGLMLPGAFNGIIRFITPNFSILNKSEVWIEAAVQIFYSVGAGFGVHLAYASYNQFDNNCFRFVETTRENEFLVIISYRDCVATVIVNSGTSLLAGFVVFSYLGYISFLMNDEIDSVVTHGTISFTSFHILTFNYRSKSRISSISICYCNHQGILFLVSNVLLTVDKPRIR